MRTIKLGKVITPALAWSAAFFTFAAVLNPFMQSPAPVQGTTFAMKAVNSTSVVTEPDWHTHPWLDGRATLLVADTRPITYTVKAGEYLSEIASKEYGTQAAYFWLAEKNHIAAPYVITAGQVLRLPGARKHYPKPPATEPPARVTTVTATAAAPPPASGGFGAPSAAYTACVVSNESGGNPDIWNASGHWGLFQFAEQTWVSAGGAASLFGKAGSSYQYSIYYRAYSMWGSSPWVSDGC